MDKMTYSDYYSLYWLARKEALRSAKNLKDCNNEKGSDLWNKWLNFTKRDSALAVKAKKLATAHIAG
jgi:hypothetical protein